MCIAVPTVVVWKAENVRLEEGSQAMPPCATGVLCSDHNKSIGSAQAMLPQKRIYCVEGVHDWGSGQIEPTVEPMLELLQRTGYWPHYQHRTCATIPELEWRLTKDWSEWCAEGSILHFFTHGGQDQIWLQPNAQAVGILTLKEWLDCTGCHVHFGGCGTFSQDEDNQNLRNFMEHTGAVSVSGYATEARWLGFVKPALPLELQLFGLLHDVYFKGNTKNRLGKLRKIEQEINSRFGDCEFRMLVHE